MSEKEVRILDLDSSKLQVEKREDGTQKINGYAVVYNSDSEDMGFIETIKPGAAKSALRKSDVRALFNHDQNLIFGRSGVNLKLKEDKIGVFMEVSPIATSTYKMVEENIQAGLVTQQSFAFTVAEDEWNEDYTRRTIVKINQIFDVSPVTYPAYADTTVALRCKQEAMGKAITDDELTKSEDTPTSNASDDSNSDNSSESPTSKLQTAEELEERYKQKLNNHKGLY